MKLIFVTLFPNLIKPYFEDSIMKRALDKGFFTIDFINFRDYAENKHNKVDTSLVGGGAGMILDNIALRNSLKQLQKENPNSKTIFLTPVAKTFHQKDAIRLAKEKTIIFVNGRYEGFDERLIEDFANEVLSIGDFVITGGELASLVIADAVLRNVEGVLGNNQSLKGESFENNLLEAPNFSKMGKVPTILKGGNHKKIEEWKLQTAICKTKFHKI